MWHTVGQKRLLWQNLHCVTTFFSFQFASDESFCPFICPDHSPCNSITSTSYIIITMNSFRSLDLALGELTAESKCNNQWLNSWTVIQIKHFTRICKVSFLLNMFASVNKVCLFSCVRFSHRGWFSYLPVKSLSNYI